MTATADQVPADPLALDNQVCFALSVASRGVVAVYKPLLEPLRLTHPQYLVMLVLWEHAPRSVKELSRLLQLDPGTLSPLLKRLEALGYLRRQRDAKDERQLSVTLTHTGVALREQAECIPAAVVERLGIDVAVLRQLHGILGEVIGATRTAASPS
jgi:DNA-binding MarR family transcriptional regulator